MPARLELPADHPHVALVTIDRPERANSLDPATLCDLARAWRQIADDAEIRCAVLTGPDPSISWGQATTGGIVTVSPTVAIVPNECVRSNSSLTTSPAERSATNPNVTGLQLLHGSPSPMLPESSRTSLRYRRQSIVRPHEQE